MKLLKTLSAILLAGTLTALSCERFCQSPLTLPLVANTSTLRTDGYYWEPDAPGRPPTVQLWFLYQNGVASAVGGFPRPRVEVGDFGGAFGNGWSDQDPTGLGTYRITGRVLEMENWTGKPLNGCNATNYRRGEILSDTSFVITYIETRGDGKVSDGRELNQRLVFRRYSPKPDSTNVFVR
jgi:hypothetical protein